MYLEIFSRVYFNLLNDVTEFVSFNCFSSERLEDKLKSQKHRDVHYCLSLIKLLVYLSSCTDPNYTVQIYNIYER